MDSAALLDLLGNENRRRILRLLARKPCYVTEISDYLGVSPKAVIDHLRMLEEAGLVESRVDDKRRKYFHISRNLRLEVNLSPYEFGAKSAYPASRSLDITTCRYVSVDVQLEGDGGDGGSGDDGNEGDGGSEDGGSEGDDADPGALATKLRRLRDLEDELSMAQRWVQGRITETVEELTDPLEGEPGAAGRLHTDLLVELADGPTETRTLAERLDVPPGVVEEALLELSEQELVERGDGGWRLVG